MPLSVSFKPCSLGYSELFQLGAAVRYPRSSRPVLTWMVRESLCIALFGGLLCALAGFVSYPRLAPVPLAFVVVPSLLFTWSVYVVLRLRSTHRAYRTYDTFVVELSEDGVTFRNRDTEWRTRWKSDFEMEVTPHFVIVSCGKTAKAGIPRKSFASLEAADEFVRVGRLFQAAATGETTQELKGGSLEEV
jgi:hypothetical protein